MTTTTQKGQRAVVLGGGIAGLAAAGVLARHFVEVVLIERDRYPGAPGVRTHVQHGSHAHVLLASGLNTLSRLVPALPGGLDELGYPEGDLTQSARAAYEGRWLPRAKSGVPIRTCLRPDVEYLLLRDVRSRPNVTIREGCRVEGLTGAKKVTGVRLACDGVEETLTADLVVDAMGRASASRTWLESHGLPRVEEDVVDAGVVYSSCWFAPTADIADDWTVLATLPVLPKTPKMGFALRIAGRGILCSAVSYGKPKPPRTPEEMVAHMADLCVPELHNLIRDAKPTSDVAVYGNTQNRLKRYSRLPHFPDGLVVIGDATCSLNPRYGQGMTIAALGADRLEKDLVRHFATRGDLVGFSQPFQRGLEQALYVPWQMALLEDRGWAAHASGSAPRLHERFALAGARRVLQTAFSDLDTYIRFMRVAHLLDAPTIMMHPLTVAKLAMGGWGAPKTPAGPGIGALVLA